MKLLSSCKAFARWGVERGTPICLHFSICARHPCAGAVLIFSASSRC